MGMLTIEYAGQTLQKFNAAPTAVESLIRGVEAARIPVKPEDFARAILSLMVVGKTPNLNFKEEQDRVELLTYVVLMEGGGIVVEALKKTDVKVEIIKDDDEGGFHFHVGHGSQIQH